MVHREDERAESLRAAGAEVVARDVLEPADVYRVSVAVSGFTSACPCLPGTWKRPLQWPQLPGKLGWRPWSTCRR